MVKRIWTASFAVYSAGWVAMLLAVFYAIIDGMKWKGWAFPLVVVGMNSIAAYVMGGVFGGWFRSLTGTWIAPLEPHLGTVWFPVFQKALFAVCAWGVLYWLYRRRVFFRL
jgi:heparan-alpha-glucosaminide N-acetyltransferase